MTALYATAVLQRPAQDTVSRPRSSNSIADSNAIPAMVQSEIFRQPSANPLLWGMITVAFAAIMLLLARRGTDAPASAISHAKDKGENRRAH